MTALYKTTHNLQIFTIAGKNKLCSANRIISRTISSIPPVSSLLKMHSSMNTLLVGFVVVLMSFAAGEKSVKLFKRQTVSGTPTCPQPLYTGVVSENALPGTSILTVAATSATGQLLRWSIQDTTFQKFAINPTTGVVSVAGSLARSALRRSALEFRIRATDPSNNLYCESTVRVNILPNSATTANPLGQAPFFAQNGYSFTVSQASAGTQIGQVTAQSATGNVIYSISGSSLFSIDPFSGIITATGNINPGTYLFQVIATSAYGTTSTTVTVNVQGSSQTGTVVFPQTVYSYSSQSCTTGSVIGQVAASSSSVVTYSVSGSNQFAINPTTGQITIVGTVGSGTYTFNVIGSSSSGQQAVTLVSVTLNCAPIAQPPSFSQTSYTVQTSACTSGTNIAIVQAGGSATTPTTYALSGTNLFSINAQTGQITLNQQAGAGSYTFQIFATSVAGSASATVTVNIQCASTSPTLATYYTTGSCPAGTQIGSICSGNPLNYG